MKNFAHLKESCPFYSLFPNGMVPIKTILLPTVAECEGDGPPQPVYMVNIQALTSAQMDAILDLLTAATPDLREEAKRDIQEKGLPLRAKNVSCTSSDVPFFL